MGDSDNIIIRSSWELRVFQFCDNNVNVLRWGSEEIAIPYMKPCPEGFRPAKYYPDLCVEYINRFGEHIKEIIEVKPEKFTKASKSRNSATKMFENQQYIVNMAKFNAADLWCKRNGFKFSVLSEKSIFRK
ncbi:head completion protein [Xanthomonas phage Xoo-sp13]|nr:head completion protein [Xanthomonas phage Xoo-sp13]